MAADRIFQDVPTFVLVFFRTAGMMLSAPLFGSARVPRPLKVLMALVLALGITPSVPRPDDLPQTPWGLALGIGGEIIFGVALGLGLTFTFMAVSWAGNSALTWPKPSIRNSARRPRSSAISTRC